MASLQQMRDIREKFDDLEDLLLNHRRTLAQNTGVPFLRLVYQPDEEHLCRRLQDTLARSLAQKQIPVQIVSCRGAVFAHYEQRDRLEQLFELERQGTTDLQTNIARHARRELEKRLAGAVSTLGQDGVILLTDTAFVYPYFQLGSALDTFTNRIIPPMALVVFYPGKVDLDGQLSFLGQRPSGYYRTRNLI